MSTGCLTYSLVFDRRVFGLQVCPLIDMAPEAQARVEAWRPASCLPLGGN